jgi:hypothetical protein
LNLVYGKKLIANTSKSLVEIDCPDYSNYYPNVSEIREYFEIKSQIDTKHILVQKRIERSYIY